MQEQEVERRLTTIVALDVVGYSRMMAGDEAGTLARIKALERDIVAPKAAALRGRIVKLVGDGILMEFGSVVDALNFTVDLQKTLSDQEAAQPDVSPLQMRAGINIGDVIVSGDDIYGDGVNVAARLEALAEPGTICVSHGVVEHVRNKVPFGFEDLGPQQVKNIPDPVRVYQVRPDQPAGASIAARPRRRRPTGLVLALFALALIGGLAVWQWPWEVRIEPALVDEMAFPLPDVPSLAVLPFDDLSDDAAQSYFADGLTEDLITDLSKVNGLFVIARNSSFAFKGREVTIKDVAEAMGVRYVLEGSVRRAADTVRVNVQLVDATTGGHVWADRFDGGAADIFAVQDRFVMKIVQALELKLSDREMSEMEQGETASLEAKHAYQRGWELYSRFNEQDNAAAVPHFQRAVELDPEFGRAWGALALVHLRGSIFHWERAMGHSRAELYRNLVPRYLEKANAYPTSLAHVVRAMQHLFYRDQSAPEGTNRGTDDARREAGLAIALQPSDPEAHVTMGWALIAAGQPVEGLNFVKSAMRLNPTYPSHYVLFAAAAEYAKGDLEAAVRRLNEGLERDPKATALAPFAAAIAARLGRRDHARARLNTWRPGAGQGALEAEAAAYDFPIRWVGSHRHLNTDLMDGLNLAVLPLESTVQDLVAGLPGQAPADQVQTLRKLGWFGPAGAPAVSQIAARLDAAHSLVRREAIITLGKIGPQAQTALPALRAVEDEPLIGYHARVAIERISGG